MFRVWGLGFRVWGLGFRVRLEIHGCQSTVLKAMRPSKGFKVSKEGLGCRVPKP